MKSTEFLSDARRNPEQNPKVSVNQAIQDALDSTDERIPNSKFKNVFVSFTSIPKLGINPKSTYNTPIGIYAYPGQYVMDTVKRVGTMSKLPFVGDQPYANIFKSNGNIIQIDKLREDNLLMSLYEDLRRVMSPFEKGEMRGGYMHYEDFVDKFLGDEAYSNAKVDSEGGYFWYVTMRCAEVISKRKGIEKPIAWNWLFRQMGVDGFVDGGAGIIHENEPVQAVFFSMNDIEVLDRVANKYSPEYMSGQEYRGREIKRAFDAKFRQLRPILQSGSVDDLIEWLDYGTNHTYLRYVPAQLRPQVLTQRPFYLHGLKEPTKNDMYAAFTTSPGLMADYGERLMKLLTLDDIVAILRKFNDRMDVSDLARKRTVMAQQLKYIMLDVGDQGKRMDFITELLRANLSIWKYIEDQYIPYATGMREEFREMVYKIAKQQGSQYIINDLSRAGAF